MGQSQINWTKLSDEHPRANQKVLLADPSGVIISIFKASANYNGFLVGGKNYFLPYGEDNTMWTYIDNPMAASEAV